MPDRGGALRLSTIVPYGGNAPLARWAEFLALQQIDWGEVEVVLATTVAEEAETLLRPYLNRFPIRIVDCGGSGLGHGAAKLRNAGARAALGTRLAFVDSDCLLHPGALSEHAAAGDVACGWIREVQAARHHLIEDWRPGRFDRLWEAAESDYRERERALDAPTAAEWTDCYSGSVSLPKDLFATVGGFDEAGFRCHDMDLGFRLWKAAARFAFLPACKAVHVEHPRSLIYRVAQHAGWQRMAERFPEVAPVAELNVGGGQQRLRALFQDAAIRFNQAARRVPGVDAGTVRVARPGTPREVVERALHGLAWIRHERHACAEYQVRVTRDCWDFSILLPESDVVRRPNWSVLIAAFRAAATLPRALRSVLRQTDQSFEIVIVDDGSHDGTPRAIAPFLADGRIRYLRNWRNKGQSAALNRGLAEARGIWLVQLDADDWLDPDCLDRLSASLSLPGTAAAYGAPRIWTGREVRRTTGRPVDAAEGHFAYADVQAPRAYRVEAARAAGGWRTDDGYRGRYYEDRRMLAAMHAHGAVRFAGEGLYNVSEHAQSLARSVPLETASAKLAIVANEANARGMRVEHRVVGDFLRVTLQPPLGTPSVPWSVIIPHREQWAHLRRTLWSWADSDLPPESEIFVIDDASSAEPLDGLLEIDPRIKLIRLDSAKGPSAARNAGARLAFHEHLIFSDADHLVPPHICAAHARVLSGPDALSCGGVFARRAVTAIYSDLPPFRRREIIATAAGSPLFDAVSSAVLRNAPCELIGPGPDMWRRAQALAFDDLWARGWGQILLRHGEDLSDFAHAWLRVGTGNLAMKRALYDRVGGFDEQLRSKEDWDFGLRAQSAGAAIIANLEAETLHQLHSVRADRPEEDRLGSEALACKHPRALRALRAEAPASRPPGADSLFNHSRRRSNGVPSSAPAQPPLVALTFDDGPHPTGTPMLLDVLQRRGARATFFVLGSRIFARCDLLARTAAEGHELAIHGWSHAHPSTLSARAARAQVEQGFAALADATGLRPRFFRPPYGLLTAAMADACRELELTVAGWHLAPCDWRGDEPIEMMQDLAEACVPGSVVLLHDGAGEPANSARLVDWLLCGLGEAVAAVPLHAYAIHLPVPELELTQPPSLDEWRGKSILDLVETGEI